MAITRYAQNVAVEQIPFANYPGGGPIPGPAGNQGFNDPALEIGACFEVTTIYQMYGNEAASDVINIYLAHPNTIVGPSGSVSGSGVATTATLNIGDDDTTGYGLVSSGAAFEGPQLSITPLGASPTRYAKNINVVDSDLFTDEDLYEVNKEAKVAFDGGTDPKDFIQETFAEDIAEEDMYDDAVDLGWGEEGPDGV